MEKVSVVMTTYNSIAHIKKTLESVLRQDYPCIEIIICDGGSVDGTLDVIREYAVMPNIDLKWISEKDQGIYDAMNKGYRMCSGDIVTFFNDIYTEPDSISRSVRTMKENEAMGVHSDLVYRDGERVIRYWKMGRGKIKHGWMPGHPTLFLKREVFEKYGLYKISYKISADYEFMVRILKDESFALAYIPQILVSMYYGGTSTGGIAGYLDSIGEAHRALKENNVRGAWMIDLLRTCRVMNQFIRGKCMVNVEHISKG